LDNAKEKPIKFTRHAMERMAMRGSNAGEVSAVIRQGKWLPAKRGKWHCPCRLELGQPSPVNGLPYAYKTVDVVFAEEPAFIVVLTVKVYYHD